jgi:DNA-binding LacI/PurR family transcriptional regulator
MRKPKPSQMSAFGHEAREIAVRACCDPRTVVAFLNGKQVWSTTAARIEEALSELGYSPDGRHRSRTVNLD